MDSKIDHEQFIKCETTIKTEVLDHTFYEQDNVNIDKETNAYNKSETTGKENCVKKENDDFEEELHDIEDIYIKSINSRGIIGLNEQKIEDNVNIVEETSVYNNLETTKKENDEFEEELHDIKDIFMKFINDMDNFKGIIGLDVNNIEDNVNINEETNVYNKSETTEKENCVNEENDDFEEDIYSTSENYMDNSEGIGLNEKKIEDNVNIEETNIYNKFETTEKEKCVKVENDEFEEELHDIKDMYMKFINDIEANDNINEETNVYNKSETTEKVNCIKEENDEFDDLKDSNEFITSLNKKKYSCNICEKSFTLRSYLKVHIRHHRHYISEKNNKYDACKKSFSQIDNLKNHKQCYTGEKNYKCDTCKKSFTQMDNQKNHNLCDTCEKSFTRKLKKRIVCNTGKKNVQCSICDKVLSRPAHLNLHLLVHTGEQDYKCGICKRGFTRGVDLKVHMRRVHNDKKNFMCNVCEKAFPCYEDLKQHRPVHTVQNYFKCTVCGLSFSKQAFLKNHHSMVHVEKKRFKCTVCDLSFSKKALLKNHHSTVHTKEKHFKCTVCEKSFSQKADVRIPDSVAHADGKKNYKCDFCVFSEKSFRKILPKRNPIENYQAVYN